MEFEDHPVASTKQISTAQVQKSAMDAATNKIRELEAEISALKTELNLYKRQNEDLRLHILQQANVSLDLVKGHGETKWVEKKDAYIDQVSNGRYAAEAEDMFFLGSGALLVHRVHLCLVADPGQEETVNAAELQLVALLVHQVARRPRQDEERRHYRPADQDLPTRPPQDRHGQLLHSHRRSDRCLPSDHAQPADHPAQARRSKAQGRERTDAWRQHRSH